MLNRIFPSIVFHYDRSQPNVMPHEARPYCFGLYCDTSRRLLCHLKFLRD